MHEPAVLELLAISERQLSHGRRRWAMKYGHWQCPQCQQQFTRLYNQLKYRRVECVGTAKLRIAPREKNPG